VPAPPRRQEAGAELRRANGCMLDGDDSRDQYVMLVGKVENMEAPKQVIPMLLQLSAWTSLTAFWRKPSFSLLSRASYISAEARNGKGSLRPDLPPLGYMACRQRISKAERRLWIASPAIAPNLKGGNSVTIARTTNCGFSSLSMTVRRGYAARRQRSRLQDQ